MNSEDGAAARVEAGPFLTLSQLSPSWAAVLEPDLKIKVIKPGMNKITH